MPTTAPTHTRAGVSRAEVTRALIRMPPGFGRDLLELTMLYPAPSAPALWDRFGHIEAYQHFDLRTLTITDPLLERRAYVQAAQAALAQMMLHGLRDRSGTHFRWAAAMLEELATHPLRRAAMTWRAMATESRYTEWRDRCDRVYQLALNACREAAREAAVDLAAHIRAIREPVAPRPLAWLRAPVMLASPLLEASP